MSENNKLSKATIGGGCFWCLEAIFQQINGVESVTSGYSGDIEENANYKKVCSGSTKHAEVIQIKFDKNIISYKEILELFWSNHDPTTPNRQGNDIGPQYRSIIFYHDNEQRKIANELILKLNKQQIFESPIVTELTKLETFYPAEEYHQNYFNLNVNSNPYCTYVILPKINKLKELFSEKLKQER